MKLVDFASRVTGIEKDEILAWANREALPLLRAVRQRLNLLLADTDCDHEASHAAASYSWAAWRYGSLFIEQDSGAALAISLDEAALGAESYDEGRRFCLAIANGTGGSLTVTFSADFTANGATLAAGETGTWMFVVAPPDWTGGRLVQAGDAAVI